MSNRMYSIELKEANTQVSMKTIGWKLRNVRKTGGKINMFPGREDLENDLSFRNQTTLLLLKRTHDEYIHKPH